jgi:hypothetical protein
MFNIVHIGIVSIEKVIKTLKYRFIFLYNHNKCIYLYTRLGTTSLHHLEENLFARKIVLTPSEVREINAIFIPTKVAGDRYAHMAMTFHGN